VLKFNVAELTLVETAFVFNKVAAVKEVMLAFVILALPALTLISIKLVVVILTVVKVPATDKFPETATFPTDNAVA